MNNKSMALILFAIVLGSCAAPTGEIELITATESAPLIAIQADEQEILPQLNQITFELVNAEPIQMEFPGGEELQHIGIIRYENQIYQVYVLAVNQGVSYGWYFAVSTDGVEWVIDQEPIEFPLVSDKDIVNPNHLEALSDGRWRLITTHSAITPSRMGVDQEIWAMTSDTLQGPWTLEDEPLLVAGEDGRWDQHGVLFTTLFSDDELYYMLYVSSTLDFQGLAISDDGITWRRSFPDGITGPYPEYDNLLSMVRRDGFIYPQIVWRIPTGFQMVYHYSEGLGGIQTDLRSAISSDGVNWEPIEVEFLFENPHDNEVPRYFTPFWVEGQLNIAYCLLVEGENECYLGRLVETLAE